MNKHLGFIFNVLFLHFSFTFEHYNSFLPLLRSLRLFKYYYVTGSVNLFEAPSFSACASGHQTTPNKTEVIKQNSLHLQQEKKRHIYIRIYISDHLTLKISILYIYAFDLKQLFNLKERNQQLGFRVNIFSFFPVSSTGCILKYVNISDKRFAMSLKWNLSAPVIDCFSFGFFSTCVLDASGRKIKSNNFSYIKPL